MGGKIVLRIVQMTCERIERENRRLIEELRARDRKRVIKPGSTSKGRVSSDASQRRPWAREWW